MARIAKANARVASSTTNEPDCGTIKAIATRAAATIRILACWLTIDRCSLSSKQAGRFDRQDQNHRRIEREIGDFREQRLAEIIGEADRQRADRGAAQAAHAADNDHRESERQHLEIEAGINAEKRAADHAAKRGQE